MVSPVTAIHLATILQLLTLLLLANGSPVVGKKILGDRLAYPLDGGRQFLDSRPLLGVSKTMRGIFLGIAVPTACAPIIDLNWRIGAIVGIAAMMGDLLSSFVKRRLNLPPSSQAIGLDQIPESLFPSIACQFMLELSVLDIAIITIAFFVGENLLSRFLYSVHLRDRPY